jgi:predicted nucleic acid-binding protein
VRLVIADTGPINYLIQIGHIEIFPHIFERIALPSAVQGELSDSRAPLLVRRWIAEMPAWLEIHDTIGLPQVSGLHRGETAAIALAKFLHADLLLMDEREGVHRAKREGLRVTGTLGILDLAAQRGLLDLESAFVRLRSTSFRCPESIMQILLERHRQQESR